MRIPSQLNRDSLYRPKNQRPRSNDDYRRIIRLCLGLVLVLLVMKQAARPSVYQTFFDPSATSSPESNLTNSRENPTNPNSPQTQNQLPESSTASYQFSAVDRKISDRLAGSLPQSDQQLWLKSLLEWKAGSNNAVVPSSVESLHQELTEITPNDINGLGPNDSSFWKLAVDTLPPWALASSDEEKAINIKRLAFLAALDRQATMRVVDGSVWRSGDFDSLYSFLHQSPFGPRSNLPMIGVLPLLQQPDVYRNQWIQVGGEVARVDYIKTPENPYNIAEYWQLWLRPLDGVNRPIIAIVPAIPKQVANFYRDGANDLGPELIIAGRYLKRLSYQSGVGADLTPVVVGEIRSAPRDVTSEVATPTEKESSPISLPLIILIAVSIGIAGSVTIMWNTAQAAKRSRKLRQSHQQKEMAHLEKMDLSQTDQPA